MASSILEVHQFIRAAVGLTRAERDLITKPDPDHQHDYWAESADTVLAQMSQLRRFLDKAGLKTEPVGKSELDYLLAGHFINPCGDTLTIAPENPSHPADRCDTSKMQIKGLDGVALDRIHRFLRLWRKIAWPINLLDRLIASPSVGKGRLDQACLVALAEIVWLARKWDMEPQALAAWFADISVFGEHSDYRRIFLQKQDNGYPYQPFLIANLCPLPECEHGAGPKPVNGGGPADANDCPTLEQHKEQVAAALGVSTDELSTLLDYCGNEPGADTPAKLSLRNLSRVWAWFRLSKKLGLKMHELTLLLAMLGIKDALDSPTSTYRIREAVVLMKKWGLKVADLRFWLLHRLEGADEEAKRVIPDLAIAKLLGDIRAALWTIRDARPAKDVDADDDASTCVAKMTSALSQVPDFTPEKALELANLLQSRPSMKEVADLNELLTKKPLGTIEGVTGLAGEAPVNAAGAWSDDQQVHSAHLGWTSRLVKALLDHLDQQARNDAVIRLTSQQTKAPVEQMDAILNWCRMPKDGVPAKGDSLLSTLAAPRWAANPVPDKASPELAKAIKELWDGALCATQVCVDKLEEKPRRFRTAVLTGTPIAAWTEPPQLTQVEEWRRQLTPLFVAIRLAHKVAGLAKALKLQTAEQLAWGLWRDRADKASLNRFQQLGPLLPDGRPLGWFSPDEMPLEKSAGDSELAVAYPRWVLLLEGLELIEQYPRKETAADPNVKHGATTALELALKPATDLHGNPVTGLESIRDVLAVCYEMFGTSNPGLYEIAGWLELPRAAFRIFGETTLGEAKTRLCIPAFEGRHGEPWIFKTPHHPDYQRDRVERMVKVGLSTAAAPTFFEALPNNGYMMVDGGLWANNPIMNALVDALACYDLDRGRVQILSLGCGETAFKVDDRKARGGLLHWWNVIRAAMRAQSLNALGQAYLLVGKDHVMRIDAPESPNAIALDDYRRARQELPLMARSLTEGAGREIARVFLSDHANTYRPCAVT